jgi:hypothetical protein
VRAGLDPRLRELADRVPDVVLRVAQVEIHVSSSEKAL